MKIFRSLQLVLLTVLVLTAQQGAAHWTTKGPYGGKVKCMTVVDTMVYIGTADGGVYRSTNSFVTSWKYINYTGLTNPNILALGSIGSKVIASTAAGIFRSNDQGNTWIAQNGSFGNNSVLSLLTMGQYVFAGTTAGIFRSSDSAATWTLLNSTISPITAMAVDGNTLYAGTSGTGVFKSTNAGVTWTPVNTNLSAQNQVIYSLAIAGGNIFAGTSNGICVTPSGSINWSLSTLSGKAVNGLFVSGSDIYAASEVGVYKSNVTALSWTTANTGYTSYATSVLVFNNKMYMGTLDDGIYRSNSTSNISWSQLNNGFNNLTTYAVYNDNFLVMAATSKGLFVSRDLAATYVAANNGLTDSTNINCFVFAGTKLYVGTKNDGVFMSPDTGRTWSAVNNNLASYNIVKLGVLGNSLLAVAPTGLVYMSSTTNNNWTTTSGLPAGLIPTALASDGSTAIYLSTAGSGVYKSTDAMSWTFFSSGLGNNNITSLAIKGGNIYAGTNGGGIYKSATSADAWTTCNNGLPTMSITALCAAGQWITAGYKGGVYASFDDGNSWLPPNILLYIPQYADVTGISYTAAGTRIFISTPNNSLYSNALTELPVGIQDYQNDIGSIGVAPNPNNGNFEITFKNIQVQVQDIAIYDNSGKAIQHIVPAKGQDVANVTIQAPPALYFVRVATNKGALTQKVIVK